MNKQLLEEAELIKNVCNEGCSVSLEKLVKKYAPMIELTRKNFQLNLYERDDWFQEARIVCHKTCLLFDGSQGSKFGCFFKMRFHNHATNLLRSQMTYKRRSNHNTVSWNKLEDFDPEFFEALLTSEFNVGHDIDFLSLEIDQYLQELTTIERQAYQVLLGEVSIEQACLNSDCDKRKMNRAIIRCKQKLKQFYETVSR